MCRDAHGEAATRARIFLVRSIVFHVQLAVYSRMRTHTLRRRRGWGACCCRTWCTVVYAVRSSYMTARGFCDSGWSRYLKKQSPKSG